MKRVTLLALTLLLAAAIALLLGCSSDKLTEPVMGDTNAPAFQLVQGLVANGSLEGVNNIVDISMSMYDSIPGVSTSPKRFANRAASGDGDVIVIDSFNYVYSTGWHVFSFWVHVADTVSGDTVDVSGIDSLEALRNDTAMQVPDTTVDEIYIRAHYDLDLRNGNLTASADDSVDIDHIDWNLTTPVTIAGKVTESASGTVTDSNVTVTFSFTNTMTAHHLVANLDGSACPDSGSLHLNSAIDISVQRDLGTSVDTLNINGNWAITAAFDNGTVKLTYSDGATFWQVTQSCSTPVASPISRWIPNLD